MVAPSYTQFASLANFKFFKNPTIEISLKRLKVWDFICVVMNFANLAIYLETDLSNFVDMSARWYVR